MEKILGSVGRRGINRSADVTIIQKLLNAQKIPGEVKPLKVDGKIGANTIARIEAFQKHILKMQKPDGKVDINGKNI